MFVARMNLRAASLGLSGSRFDNPCGHDAPGHHATARDLLRLTKAAVAIPEFRRTVALDRAWITTRGGRVLDLRTNNVLLGRFPGASGVKSGYTPLRFWSDVVAKAPHNGRAHGNLGYALALACRGTEAEEAFARALALDPGDLRAAANLGLLREGSLLPAEAAGAGTATGTGDREVGGDRCYPRGPEGEAPGEAGRSDRSNRGSGSTGRAPPPLQRRAASSQPATPARKRSASRIPRSPAAPSFSSPAPSSRTMPPGWSCTSPLWKPAVTWMSPWSSCRTDPVSTCQAASQTSCASKKCPASKSRQPSASASRVAFEGVGAGGMGGM